ncbi:MAG TPA: hypothetical protein PLZ84_03675, partial [Clostridia bacterium]|nr:hypothetical protein [Clostridia bacterium]
MMTITINNDHSVSTDVFEIGREFEHNVESIEIILPDAVSGYDMYLEFILPDNKKYLTEALEAQSGKITYRIPNGLLSCNGVMVCQFVARSGEYVWKSDLWEAVVNKSVNAEEAIPVSDPDWLNQVGDATAAALSAAQAANDAAQTALNAIGPPGPPGPQGPQG